MEVGEKEMSKPKIVTKEFDGHVRVTVSDNEVRLWVCNSDSCCVFRLKALGKTHVGEQDVMVMSK